MVPLQKATLHILGYIFPMIEPASISEIMRIKRLRNNGCNRVEDSSDFGLYFPDDGSNRVDDPSYLGTMLCCK